MFHMFTAQGSSLYHTSQDGLVTRVAATPPAWLTEDLDRFGERRGQYSNYPFGLYKVEWDLDLDLEEVLLKHLA